MVVTANYLTGSLTHATFLTEPPGLDVTVDGQVLTTPLTLSWSIGSYHEILADSLIVVDEGHALAFDRWSDGGQRRHDVQANLLDRTYTAYFRNQVLLTMSADPEGQVLPGTMLVDQDSSLSISAIAAEGYSFTEWVGTGPGSYSGPANPVSVTPTGPVTEVARFEHAAMAIHLSLSDTDPNVHVGTPAGVTQVFLWFVCGSGQPIGRLEARITGSLVHTSFVNASGVVNGGSGSDLDLFVSDCPGTALVLGHFFVFDSGGGDLCLGPTASTGRLAASNCSLAPEDFSWPTDLRVHGVSLNGSSPCASGRACDQPSDPVSVPAPRFELAEAGRAVEVRWTSEDDALGFRVYRSESAAGELHARHDGLLRGASPHVWRDTDVLPGTTYWYVLAAVEALGEESRAGPLRITTSRWLPLRLAFDEVRPNPFQGRTHIGFALERAEQVRCLAYDVSGRLVATIVDAPYPSGEHEIAWDGRDVAGRRLSAGLYFLRFTAGGFTSTRKVVLLDGG
jgi:hypothetical protein